MDLVLVLAAIAAVAVVTAVVAARLLFDFCRGVVANALV